MSSIGKDGSSSLAPVSDEEEFKPFRETYRIQTFTMIVGMLYPTPERAACRVAGIAVATATAIPICSMVFVDMWTSWKEGDVINIMRHITVIGPYLAAIFKMMLFFKNRADAWRIINKIDEDHCRYNTLPESHKIIARRHIDETVYYSEKCWCVVVATCVSTFPMTAAILTFYNFVFKEEPVKHMVHDIRKPFSPPEDRFSSPYYEIMSVYMAYCAVVYILSFIGYDAFFGVTIKHACMKMELFCETMEDAMRERDGESRKRRMMDVITEQNDVFRMVELIQKTFNIWLGLIVIATVLQICNLMYQLIENVDFFVSSYSESFDIQEKKCPKHYRFFLYIYLCGALKTNRTSLWDFFLGYGIEHKYLIFIFGCVAHIYLPCRYAAKLEVSALEVGSRLYCCGWERVNDERARKMIAFMIARAQVPMKITAFNMIDFNMELFVSIMQTSYSMFTLMKK